ncbi:MAG: hypothetical protein IRZ28_14135 [Steroidobacteraceae bacterium]|nr:hypothetical protein [Steroidobacteraceae bacterium]
MRGALAALLLAATVAGAQEGFPLDGTWRGERPAAGGGTPVTIVMVLQWDGKNITGVINPGPKAIPVTEARLIPEGWRVTLTAQTPDGKPISFEGKIEDLGAYDRKIAGTWTEGGRAYAVRMVRE